MKWARRILLGLVVVLVGLFLVFRTPDTDVTEMRARYGAPPSQFVELGKGLTVHLRDEGPRNAPVVMLLHGSNADLHTWQPWVDQLKRDYRVIRFDQIGHGLTGPAPDDDYSSAAFVEDVDRVADRLRLNRFVLAGNSMGGAVALRYAVDHPDRLAGLVLIDAAGAPKQGNERGNIGFKIAATPGINMIVQSVTPRSLVKRSLEQSVSNKAIVTDAAVDRYWELLRYPGNRAAMVARFSGPRETFAASVLSNIDVPTLIMWGEEDPLIGPEGAQFFHRGIRGSQVVTFPGIGHLPQEEAPRATVEALRGWLAALPQAGGAAASH